MKKITAVLGGIGAFGALFLFVLYAPHAFSDSASTSVNVILAQCSDTLDNDGDLLVDYPADPDCSSAVDDDESTPAPVYQCGDGTDNDGDALIDYPADGGCTSTGDNNEVNEVIVVGAGYTVPPPFSGVTSSLSTSTIVGTTSTQSTTTVYLPTLPEDPTASAARTLTDFNKDLKTNIADLSILLYHMERFSGSSEMYDLNKDGKLNIVDVSILLFYWA